MHSTPDDATASTPSPQQAPDELTDDQLCQRIGDMDDRQLNALYKFVYLLWAHKATRKHLPGLYPQSTLPVAIPALDEGEGAE